MELIVAKDYAAMCRRAAMIVAAQVLENPRSVLGLATGSTPVGVYKELIGWYQQGDLDFSEIQSVNLDEYCGLDISSDQSYVYYMRENLFRHINIKQENTHIPNGKAADLQKECQLYDKLIQDMGGIDLQILGIGHNGHIGFNEPDTIFTKETHVVNLSQKTIEANARFFASAGEVPKQACTMGIQAIMNAKTIVLLANGKAKAEAIRSLMYGPVTPSFPASILQLHSRVFVVVDEEAGSLCKA